MIRISRTRLAAAALVAVMLATMPGAALRGAGAQIGQAAAGGG
jgi:hypothetical protein